LKAWPSKILPAARKTTIWVWAMLKQSLMTKICQYESKSMPLQAM